MFIVGIKGSEIYPDLIPRNSKPCRVGKIRLQLAGVDLP